MHRGHALSEEAVEEREREYGGKHARSLSPFF
jgi:hypothetical protein